MAFESPLLEAEAIDASSFFEESSRFSVSGVPATIINDGAGEVVGAVPEVALLAEIQRAVETK
jgi:hypothetical protein